MSFVYDPRKLLDQFAPPHLIKKLITKKLTVNGAVVQMLTRTGVLTKKEVETVARKVLRDYKKRRRTAKRLGATNREADASLNDNALLIQRVTDEILFKIAGYIKIAYRGAEYEWLETTSEEPDHKHMRLWGTIRRIGRGEMPGDRYGCKCGMRIITKDRRLDLSQVT